jgi:hypothetical protein
MRARQIEAVREAVDLDRETCLERHFEHLVQVEGVLGAVVEDPPLRMAETARIRIPHGLGDDARQLRLGPPLACVQADLNPVQLCEDVVGEIEAAVREDVALDPAQHVERSETLVRGRNLLRLPAYVVGGEPRNNADVHRVIADREVLVAALTCSDSHLLDARLAIRPRRVAVKVAANVAELHEVGRHGPDGRFAELGRAPVDPEPRVHGLLRLLLRKRPERLDVSGRARSANELGPEAGRLRDDDRHGDALYGHAHRTAFRAFDDGDDDHELGKLVEYRLGVGRAADDGQVERQLAEAPRIACDVAAERVGDRLQEWPAAVYRQASSWLRRGRERCLDPRLGRRADPRN